MKAIRSKDTKPELLVRRYVHKAGLRYSLHKKGIAGKPDLWPPGRNAAVFVHGCFWHGHEGCKDFRLPKTRTDWWAEKISKNQERDKIAASKLSELGIRVFAVWECEINEQSLSDLVSALQHVRG
jgi:DNA mismatch endonuclease, patch repair protein